MNDDVVLVELTDIARTALAQRAELRGGPYPSDSSAAKLR